MHACLQNSTEKEIFVFPNGFFRCCAEYSISVWESFPQHSHIITVNHNIQSLTSALHVIVFFSLSALYAACHKLIVKILSCCTLLLMAWFVHIRTGLIFFPLCMMITIKHNQLEYPFQFTINECYFGQYVAIGHSTQSAYVHLPPKSTNL